MIRHSGRCVWALIILSVLFIFVNKKRYGFIESKQKRNGFTWYMEVQRSLVTADNITVIIREYLSAKIVERRSIKR
jgi:hypothetical protein